MREAKDKSAPPRLAVRREDRRTRPSAWGMAAPAVAARCVFYLSAAGPALWGRLREGVVPDDLLPSATPDAALPPSCHHHADAARQPLQGAPAGTVRSVLRARPRGRTVGLSSRLTIQSSKAFRSFHSTAACTGIQQGIDHASRPPGEACGYMERPRVLGRLGVRISSGNQKERRNCSAACPYG